MAIVAVPLHWTLPEGKPCASLLFAHGAGAPMDSDFMETLASLLAAQQIAVARFEFPYMAQRRHGGSKRPPDRQPVLLAAFAEALAAMPNDVPCFIGGKSMGGRMASVLASEAGPLPVSVAGVVCFSYPFHPPRRPESLRIAHLPALPVPMLICQGERDPLGDQGEVAGYHLGENVVLHWLGDGDHDLKPRKASGLTHAANLASAAAAAAAFMGRIAGA